MAFKKIIFPFLFFGLSACDSKLSVKEFSQLVVSSLSCENFETKMFDSLLLALDNDHELPNPQDLEEQLQEDFSKIQDYETHRQIINDIISKFVQMYSDIYLNHQNEFNQQTIDDIKKYLMAIETRDQTNLTQTDFIKRYKTQLDALQTSSKQLKQTCVEDVAMPLPVMKEGSLLSYIKSNYTTEVYGAYKTFATAYQNCEALKTDALTLKTKSMQGVKVTGKHSSGGGNIREIASLRDVQATHPYLSERQPSNSCYNTFQNPLIYDYGGKPKSINTQDSDLNFFENDGTGSKALGTDCSGFIFTSLVSSGLKLNPEVTPKARQVLSYNAARYVNPTSGGVTCFEKLPIHKANPIKPGDIVASTGHIFMITKTSSDPFGLDSIKSSTDCSKIDESYFDFELMQSSPSLGAIGINRMKASDYLADSATMRKVTIEFAKKQCQSKFNNQTYTQTSTQMSIVRHKKTPECLTGSEIQLTRQSCVLDCSLN